MPDCATPHRLATERLVVRPATQEDVPAVVDNYRRNRQQREYDALDTLNHRLKCPRTYGRLPRKPPPPGWRTGFHASSQDYVDAQILDSLQIFVKPAVASDAQRVANRAAPW